MAQTFTPRPGKAPIPDSGIPIFYVTRKGDDANDGRTWGTAKATVPAALTALAAVTGLQKPYWPTNSGVIQIGYGVFDTDPIVPPYGVMLVGAGRGNTTLRLKAGANTNVIQSAAWGKTGVNDIDDRIIIRDLTVDGNASAQSPVAVETVVTAQVTLSTSATTTVAVADTTGFPSSGYLFIAGATCTYTGLTTTSFTGVTKVKGENNTIYPLGSVLPMNQQGHGIALQATRCVVENVDVTNTVGSNFAIQSSTMSVPGIAYENKFLDCRGQKAGRYAWELGEGVTDGSITTCSGESGRRGALIVKGANWHIKDFHPVGMPAADGTAATRGLITVCSGMQYFDDLYLDTAMHAGLVIDTQKRQIPVYGVDADIISLYGSAGGGGGPVVRVVGGFSTTAAANVVNNNIRVRSETGGNGHILCNGPFLRTCSVGAQNWTTAAKAQFDDISALPFHGGTISVLGSLSYAGVQITETSVASAAAVGATSLTVKVRGNLDSAGVVNIPIVANRLGMRVAYTGITVNGNGTATLTGIPASGSGSIVNALTGGEYVTQHFLTGISGSSATAVPDGSTGDSNIYAQWEISKTRVEYEAYGNLAFGAGMFQLPVNGLSQIEAVDLHAGVGSRQIRIDVFGSAKATVGTWVTAQLGAAFNSGTTQNSGTSAQGDSWTSPEVWLDAGTWTLDVIGYGSTDGATVTPSLVSNRGRVVTIAGTQDQYLASAATKRDSFTGITVQVSGLYSLVLTASAKNSSSSGYRARFSGAILSRTA